MDSSSRAGAAELSSTMDPFLGADSPEMSYYELLLNWEAFAASNLVGDPPVIPEPEALTELNSHDTTDLLRESDY